MSTILDIISATFIGGIILLVTLNANFTLRQTWASYNHEVMVQQMLVSTAQMLECDLRNMGCGVPVGVQTITEAGDSSVAFLMAPNAIVNSVPEPIKYYIGPVTEAGASATDNPRDRWLWRERNGVGQKIGLVTQFKLRYMNKFGQNIPAPVTNQNDRINIRLIEITMEVQSPYPAILENGDVDLKQGYASALWKQTRIASQNLYR
jgi:hypothetical protein